MISVIIPAYNSESFLSECVDSVLAQRGFASPQEMEIIIVDDGSTDTTGAIADRYAAADSRVKVLHVPNGGLSYARNHGMDAALGDYLCFVDADDILLPDALRSLRIAILRSSADVAVASMICARQCPADVCAPKLHPRMINGIRAVELMLYQRGFLSSASAKLYRSSSVGALRFTNGLYYEDLDFNFRFLLDCQRVAFDPAPVYFYRQHSDSILHQWTPKREHVLRVVDDIERQIATTAPSLLGAAADRKLSANFNIFICAHNNGRNDLADKCWDVIRAYRRRSLTDKCVRMKNKIGILISYLGRRSFALASKLFY